VESHRLGGTAHVGVSGRSPRSGRGDRS